MLEKGFNTMFQTILYSGGVTCLGYTVYMSFREIIKNYLKKEKTRVEKTMSKTMQNTKLYIKKDTDNYLFPKLLNIENKDYGYNLKYKLPVGMTLSDFKAKKENIETAIEGEVELYADGRTLEIQAATEKIMNEYSFDKKIINDIKGKKLGVSLGYTRKGYLTVDIAELGSHIIVGGVTGSGKSVLIRQIITPIMLSYEPNYVDFKLIDLKGGLELSLFENSPFLESEKSIKTTHEEVLNLIIQLQSEMEYRYNVMRQEGVSKFAELPTNSMKYIFVIFDEYAEISPSQLKGKEEKIAKKIQGKLGKLFRQGRAAGIHFLICTQRPDAKVIDGQIRSNAQIKVAMNVASKVDSRIIIESNDAANIPPYPGRGIYKYGREKREFQTPYLTRNKAEELLKERFQELSPPEKTVDNKVVDIESVRKKKEDDEGGVFL